MPLVFHTTCKRSEQLFLADGNFFCLCSKPSNYAPSNNTYGGEFHSQPMFSQPAYSYYPEEEVQHFYKWTSPPGIIKIMSILIIVMCVGVFACVASTLAWDMDMYGYGNTLGTGVGYPNYGGSGFGGSYGYSNGYGYASYGGGAYGLGGNYIEPRSAKGFILAMAAFCFIAGLIFFVTSVTKNSMSRTTKYYLVIIIASAILLFLTFIATIVYVMAVNPTAQASGSMFYNQINILCSQYYAPTSATLFVNQYLYHYCVVEPQEVCIHFTEMLKCFQKHNVPVFEPRSGNCQITLLEKRKLLL